MKNLYIIACIVAIMVVGSCGSSDSSGYDNTLGPANATKPVTPVTIADTLLSDTTTPASAIVVKPAVKTQPVTSVNKAGLNPAHGQPGHRCDISVGAPLNSPVKKTTPAPSPVPSSPVITSPVVQQSPASDLKINDQKTTPVNGLTKINPPHGQPGHDCAVQVGAPLKN